MIKNCLAIFSFCFCSLTRTISTWNSERAIFFGGESVNYSVTLKASFTVYRTFTVLLSITTLIINFSLSPMNMHMYISPQSKQYSNIIFNYVYKLCCLDLIAL